MTAHWTDERTERLKALWKDGLTGEQIASQLGGVSREAVLGKVHRLNLSGRAKPGNSLRTRQRQANADRSIANKIKAGTLRKPRGNQNGGLAFKIAAGTLGKKTALPKVAAPAQRPIEDLPPPLSRDVSLLDLKAADCRWPLGDGPFVFCGQHAYDGSPYCEYHHRLAYVPVTARQHRQDARLA